MIASVQAHLSLFDTALQPFLEREYWERYAEAERDKVLDWIWKFDSDDKHQRTKGARAANTGHWFLNNPTFQNWLEGQNPRNATLFCPGLAGAGKTYITSLVVDKVLEMAGLQKGKIAVAFIYFEYRPKESPDSRGVAASILRQWAQSQKDLDPELRKLYAEWRANRRTANIPEFVCCMNSIATKLSSAFIILDALDEWDSNERWIFLNRVVPHLDTTRTKVFATCRPHIEDVSKFFTNSDKLVIVAHEDDLKRYVTEKLKQIEPRKKRRFDQLGSILKDEIVDKLCTQANGM